MTIQRTRTRGPDYRPNVYLGQASQHMTACPTEYTTTGNYSFPSGKKMRQEICVDELHPGPPYRTGGPFFLKRLTVEYHDSESVDARRSNWRYVGKLAASKDCSSLQSVFDGYMPSAGAYGAEAYNKFRPTKPRGDAGQWTGELRDLPKIPFLKERADGLRKTFKDLPKALGGNYMNYVFGWKPFITDLIKIYQTQKRIHKILSFLYRNNGQWRRAGGILKNEFTTVRSTAGNISTPVLSTYLYLDSSYSQSQVTTITRDTVWFKAKWKFYIPWNDFLPAWQDPYDIWGSKLLRKLYGFELTPALAWELIPFSWLQDWFINFGDVISNASNQLYDNLVAKYAYVMRHRSTMNVFDQDINMASTKPYPHCDGTRWINTGSVGLERQLKVRAVVTAECKEREHASQWAFGGGGVLDESLTPRQTAILYALGLSRRSGAR